MSDCPDHGPYADDDCPKCDDDDDEERAARLTDLRSVMFARYDRWRSAWRAEDANTALFYVDWRASVTAYVHAKEAQYAA